MKFWGNRASARRGDRSLRHEFVIGPRDSTLFSGKASLYYCIRCEWRFLVCRNRVAVLDERDNALTGTESANRFSTFEEGPCPVLEALTSDIPSGIRTVATATRRNGYEPRNLAPGNIRVGPGRTWPLLRVLNRLREDLGRPS